MAEKDLRTSIQDALQACAKGNLAKSAVALLNTLGYRSEKTYAITPNTADQFKAEFDPGGRLNDEKALTAQWKSVDILFQVADDELQDAFSKQPRIFAETALNTVNIESYLFFAVDLSEDYYARTDIANITREINKLFPMPVMVVMRHGGKLSIGIITRRVNKRDASRDVLEKVTLIKAIRAVSPHRAHVEILNDLSLPELAKSHPLASFVDLQRAWEKTLDTSELNKKFYREVADWYFWAVGNVQFPEGGEPDVEKRNATNVIRLITRLIFVWFIKEKGLVPEDLFNPQRLKAILKPGEARNGIYYKAILQNLFFATLNTEMGSDRRFRGKNHSGGRDAHYGISTVYRYEDAFIDPAAALKLFAAVPFLNGGLFECLDKREQKLLVDGFSDDSRNQPVVPDTLFFGEARDVNLNQVYGDTRHGREKVRGLIHIFNSYKFTIEENTPLEEEIALDPELLGKVFENLLAAYNPETGTTARKQTGSFYTPREIVNYMVDESLIAYLETKLVGTLDAQQRLRHLLDYNQEPHQFTEAEAKRLIDAIDGVKVLDPACGSGAFPMGVLHKLVFILSKIDPGNLLWKQRQIDKAAEIPDPSIREQVIEDIEKSFRENELDYGRKLYLIQNCIYGVDIQPIAVQIAKLRFFISLVVDQRTDPRKPNLGIRPLPNLETKFVAANTLIGIDRPQSAVLRDEPSLLIADDVREKCNLLVEKFRQYLLVRTPSLKESLLADGVRLGAQINQALINDPDWIPIQVEWIFNTAKKVDELRNALPLQQKEKVAEVQFVTAEIKSLEDRLAWVRSEIFTARTPATKHKYRDMDRQLRVDIAKLLKDDGWGSDTASLLAGWDPYDQNTSADFFDPEWMFGTSNGFDIVIGNPPWGAKLTPKEKEDFKNAYKEIDSSTPNTFAYFIGWGLRNISNNMSFVLPDSILIKDFEKTRKLIKDYVSEIIWYENAGIPEEYKPFVYVDHDVCVINITKSFSKSLR
ncbi:MAG: hypothetical protein JXB38_01020, partial [Anaerolineales bacterium]|nr:hypothetical protein [Anaerolineales bacterium]